MIMPSWVGPAPTILDIRRHAGQFGCSNYAEQLLRDPSAKLGTIFNLVRHCVALLREGQDAGGTYTGQAIQLCFSRIIVKKGQAPLAVFRPMERILREAHARPHATEEALEWAIATQRLTAPADVIRVLRAVLHADRYGSSVAEAVWSFVATPFTGKRHDFFRILDGIFARRAWISFWMRRARSQQRLTEQEDFARMLEILLWQAPIPAKRPVVPIRRKEPEPQLHIVVVPQDEKRGRRLTRAA